MLHMTRCWNCSHDLVPETARSDADSVTGSNVAGVDGTLSTVAHGGAVAVEQWQCTPRLRWVKLGEPIAGLMEAMGYGKPRLQQLWYEQLRGREEWRDVPSEQEQAPTDVCVSDGVDRKDKS